MTTKEEKLILKSVAKQKREELHAGIVRQYNQYRKKYPDESNHRIILLIASNQSMTVEGVRKILVRNNAIQNKK